MTPKVLLVNDNAASLTALESLLGDAVGRGEYEVVTARSGEEALRQVLHHDFAVIILDVRMPVMDGFETAEAIHSHPRCALVPIIFVTAHQADEMAKLKGYQKGAVDYLFTPIIPQILQTKVAVFVELMKRNQQLDLQAQELSKLYQDLRLQRLHDLERMNAELEAEVIERKKAEQREHELATRDALTGLLNRRSLMEHLEHAVVNATRRKEEFALLFLDLDKFKAVNDTLGHDVGDELLRQVATRLLEVVRESDVVARLGGDEFVVAIEALASSSQAAKVAKKIALSLARPYTIGTHTVRISASIGIGLFPQDGASMQSLVNRADKAMYHAKHKKRGSVQFFHEELNAREVDRDHFKQELQHALKHAEFVLHFQPRVNITTGYVVALQALPYWQHPSLGLISGPQFIPQAVENDLMGLVGEWLVAAACDQASQWQASQSPCLKVPIAVDLGLAQMDAEWPRGVLSGLRKHKLAPSCLQLGITESALTRGANSMAQVLQELRAAGIALAIDNFGTGYSSLAALKTLALDVLKIDPSLIQQLDDETSDGALVGGVVCIARALALRVVAQGVANAKQLAALKALGCDDYQGDFFCIPLPAGALQSWLDSHTGALHECHE
ncbi:MAG: EAL domain-containing protein [Pseudomonadota bacterium]